VNDSVVAVAGGVVALLAPVGGPTELVGVVAPVELVVLPVEAAAVPGDEDAVVVGAGVVTAGDWPRSAASIPAIIGRPARQLRQARPPSASRHAVLTCLSRFALLSRSFP
jgi:hypothetical protein